MIEYSGLRQSCAELTMRVLPLWLFTQAMMVLVAWALSSVALPVPSITPNSVKASPTSGRLT